MKHAAAAAGFGARRPHPSTARLPAPYNPDGARGRPRIPGLLRVRPAASATVAVAASRGTVSGRPRARRGSADGPARSPAAPRAALLVAFAELARPQLLFRRPACFRVDGVFPAVKATRGRGDGVPVTSHYLHAVAAPPRQQKDTASNAQPSRAVAVLVELRHARSSEPTS